MNFIQNHEPVGDGVEEQDGLGEPVAIVAVFQVEVDRIAVFADVKRQSCLAGLARAEDGDGSLRP